MLLSLRTAMSSLNSAQSAMNVIANNVANATTPGYTRQRVSLSTLSPTTVNPGRLTVGRGVGVGSLDRLSDRILTSQIQTQQSHVGRYSASTQYYGQIESLLGEPGSTGLSSTIGSFFAELTTLSSVPEDRARRQSAVRFGQDLADNFQLLERQLRDVDQSLSAAIRDETENLNGLLQQLDALNDGIASSFIANQVPSDVLDKQEVLLKDLSDVVDIRVQRDEMGRVTVTSSNAVLLTPSGAARIDAATVDQLNGRVELRFEGTTEVFQPRGGRLKGLVDLSATTMGDTLDGLDELARNLIYEMNRTHATGVPAGGGYTQLVSSNRFRDANASGSFLDERLYQTDLPFEIQDGTLLVNVTDDATGAVTRHEIDIDPVAMSVGDLVTALDGLDGLRASVDSLGQLRLDAEGGRRFDFSNRIMTDGNPQGTLGAANATVYGTMAEPFALSAGDTFDVEIDGGAVQTVTLTAAHTTAESLAQDVNAQIVGATAAAVNGALLLRSNSTGSSSSVRLTEGAGNPLAALGMSTALTNGGDASVGVTFSGAWSENANETFTFTPNMAGTIGATDGLQIEVRDSSDRLVTTLDVGAGYVPGEALSLPGGLEVAFEAGDVDPNAGHRIAQTFYTNSDSSDLLVSTGLGGFFTGDSASTIQVAEGLQADPDLLATALSDATGDNANVQRLLGLQTAAVSGLSSRTFDGAWQGLVSEVATESSRHGATMEAQSLVLESLSARRESMSGVNLDEELLLLEEYQQMYQASARFLQAVQETTDILFNLV